jgi:GNAT superfamily N-acetyltransferase
LADPIPELKAEEIPELRIRKGVPEDWSWLEPFLRQSACGPRGLCQFREWLGRADRVCLLGFAGTQLVYSSWIAFSSFYDTSLLVTMDVRPGEAFAVAAHCAPPFRRLGIHRVVHGELLRTARERGCRTVRWLLHAPELRQSLASYERAGFTQRVVGEAYYLKVLWWKRFRMTAY